MCCFFNTNAKRELSYFSANMTNEQILQILHEANGQILEEEITDYQEDLLQFIDRPSSNTRSAVINQNERLFLESSLDLNKEIFSEDFEYIFDEDDDSSMGSDSADTLEEELNNINEGVGVFSWNPNDLEYNDSDDN